MGTGYDIQGGGTNGVSLRDIELVSDGCDAEVMEGFHHRADWRISGMTAQRVWEGGWEC